MAAAQLSELEQQLMASADTTKANMAKKRRRKRARATDDDSTTTESPPFNDEETGEEPPVSKRAKVDEEEEEKDDSPIEVVTKEPVDVPVVKKATPMTLHASLVDPSTDMSIGDIFTKNTNIAMVRTPHSRRPVYVQLSGGGRCAPFTYSTEGQHGNSISLNIENQKEADGLMRISNHLLSHFTDNKARWFSDELTDDMVKMNYRAFCKSKRKDKKDETKLWPECVKAMAREETLTVEEGKSQPTLRIVDANKVSVSPDTLNESGTYWAKAIIEIKSLYTSGKTVGGVSCRWRYIELAPREADADVFDVLDTPIGI